MLYKIVSFPSESNSILVSKLKINLDKNRHIYSEENFEYLFVIGGDGSFIHFFKEYAFANIKIIGICAGTISFLSSIDVENVLDFEEAEYTELPMIKIQCAGRCLYAVNDVYVSGSDNLLFTGSLNINDRFLQKYRSLGLLISTQMGSSALNKSMDGPIIFPSLFSWLIRGIGMQNTTNIKSLENAIILSDSDSVDIYNLSKYRIYLDGQHIDIHPDSIKFSLIKSESKVLSELVSSSVYVDKIRETFLDG